MSITYQKNMTNLLRYTSFGPSLNLVSGGELQNETPVTFTRNTKRHYWDQSGILQTAAVDTLPTSYDPATGTKDGWPIMGQWTNEVLDPRDMTTGNWNSNSGSITRDGTVAPYENTEFNLLSGTGLVAWQGGKTWTNGEPITIRFLVKEETTSTVRVVLPSFRNSGASNYVVEFDISTETATIIEGSQSPNATFKHVGGGVYLVSFTVTPDSDQSEKYLGFEDPNGVYITGVELFLNRSSPPPTPVYGEVAGQSYTQDPDIATITDLDSIGFNPDEGTFVVDAKPIVLGNNAFLSINDGTLNNRIQATFKTNTIELYVADGGVEQVNSTGGVISSDTNYKIALVYKKDDYKLYLDGNSVITDASGTVPSLTKLNIGNVSGASVPLDGFVKSIKYYPRRLSNAQLQQLTS